MITATTTPMFDLAETCGDDLSEYAEEVPVHYVGAPGSDNPPELPADVEVDERTWTANLKTIRVESSRWIVLLTIHLNVHQWFYYRRDGGLLEDCECLEAHLPLVGIVNRILDAEAVR